MRLYLSITCIKRNSICSKKETAELQCIVWCNWRGRVWGACRRPESSGDHGRILKDFVGAIKACTLYRHQGSINPEIRRSEWGTFGKIAGNSAESGLTRHTTGNRGTVTNRISQGVLNEAVVTRSGISGVAPSQLWSMANSSAILKVQYRDIRPQRFLEKNERGEILSVFKFLTLGDICVTCTQSPLAVLRLQSNPKENGKWGEAHGYNLICHKLLLTLSVNCTRWVQKPRHWIRH